MRDFEAQKHKINLMEFFIMHFIWRLTWDDFVDNKVGMHWTVAQ